jgi:hypothetical protein
MSSLGDEDVLRMGVWGGVYGGLYKMTQIVNMARGMRQWSQCNTQRTAQTLPHATRISALLFHCPFPRGELTENGVMFTGFD